MPITRTFTGYYWLSASAVIGIYAKKAGVWSRITTRTVSVEGEYTSGGDQTAPWNLSGTFQLGTGIQMFGVKVESVTGYSGTATAAITDFVKVEWQAIGATGGTSSATPNGEKTTITVTPQ